MRELPYGIPVSAGLQAEAIRENRQAASSPASAPPAEEQRTGAFRVPDIWNRTGRSWRRARPVPEAGKRRDSRAFSGVVISADTGMAAGKRQRKGHQAKQWRASGFLQQHAAKRPGKPVQTECRGRGKNDGQPETCNQRIKGCPAVAFRKTGGDGAGEDGMNARGAQGKDRRHTKERRADKCRSVPHQSCATGIFYRKSR